MDQIINEFKSDEIIEITNSYIEEQFLLRDKTIFLMVRKYVQNLPLSIDINQQEFIPGDYINMSLNDKKKIWHFRYNDSKNLYKALIYYGDTRKTGFMLQLCTILQKMLLGEFPNKYVVEEESFEESGFNKMTLDKKINRIFFNELKKLPEYYEKISSPSTNEERIAALKEVFETMQISINDKKWSLMDDLSDLYHIEEIDKYLKTSPINVDGLVSSVKTTGKRKKLVR